MLTPSVQFLFFAHLFQFPHKHHNATTVTGPFACPLADYRNQTGPQGWPRIPLLGKRCAKADVVFLSVFKLVVNFLCFFLFLFFAGTTRAYLYAEQV